MVAEAIVRQVKQCELCGATFGRKPLITNASWARTKYCGKSCARASVRSMRAPDAPLTPQERAEANTCECGARATRTVHFRILPSTSNHPLRAQMKVCPTCREIMLREDKGAW
jgi:hypothetical protein